MIGSKRSLHSLRADVPQLHASLAARYDDFIEIGWRVKDHNGRESRFELDTSLKF